MFSDATLTIGATAISASITHFQLHSSNVGGAWATGAVGTRVAVSGSVDSDGDITWTNTAFTGLTPGQTIGGVSYWSASTAGTNRGGSALTGDTTANSAGEFSIPTQTENGTAA